MRTTPCRPRSQAAQDAGRRMCVAGHLVLLRSRFPGLSWCEGCGRSVWRAGFPCGSLGEDYPLSAVGEFTCRVEVTGVACRFSDHMQQDLAQVVEPPAAKQVLRPPRRCAVKGSGGNDGVGKLYLPPVGVQHRGGRQVRRNLPCVIRLVLWELLASDDGTEPEPLDVDRQMVYQPGAGPLRGQYGAPQVLLGKALQDAEHVIALIGEG